MVYIMHDNLHSNYGGTVPKANKVRKVDISADKDAPTIIQSVQEAIYLE